MGGEGLILMKILNSWKQVNFCNERGVDYTCTQPVVSVYKYDTPI